MSKELPKEFVVCVSHYIRGPASNEADAREKIAKIMKAEAKALEEKGYKETKEFNARIKVDIAVMTKPYELIPMDGVSDGVTIECAW